MSKTIIHTDDAPSAIGTYSQAVRTGNLVFISGQIPFVPETMEVVEGDFAARARQVFANLRAVLSSANASLADVVKTTVFLADMDDYAAMNEIYMEEFGDHRPARSAVAVAKLPLGAQIEIEAVATI